MSMIYERRDKNKADLHRTVTARKLLIYLVDAVVFLIVDVWLAKDRCARRWNS